MVTNRRGFTLIELLVVIAIIAILAAILFPVFARARAKAYETQCLSNIKNSALAFKIYCSDWKGYFPADHHWFQWIYPKYSSDCASLTCPKQPNPGCSNRDQAYNFSIRVYYGQDNKRPNWAAGYGGLLYRGHCQDPAGDWVWYIMPALETWVERPSQTVMLTETQYWPDRYPANSGREYALNCTGGPCYQTTTYVVFPHNDGVNVAWVDGHAERIQKGTGLLNCDPDTTWWDLGPDTKELSQRAPCEP